MTVVRRSAAKKNTHHFSRSNHLRSTWKSLVPSSKHNIHQAKSQSSLLSTSWTRLPFPNLRHA